MGKRGSWAFVADSMTSLKVSAKSEKPRLDTAIVKATSREQIFPKAKHVVALLEVDVEEDVQYMVGKLLKRCRKAEEWVVVLKAMILLHVLMRESRPQFLDVLIGATAGDERASVGNATFKDGTSTKTWSHSHFIQLYSNFLQEKIRVFSRTRLSVDHEPAQGRSRLGVVGAKLLFHQLPLFQDLLARLMECWPQQLSLENPVVVGAFQLLVKESFRLYKVINDGMINLIDKFFDLPVGEAGEALALYERSLIQTGSLERFYDFAKRALPADSVQFPQALKRVPDSFTETMRSYVVGGCVQEPQLEASSSSNLLGSFRSTTGPSSVGLPSAGPPSAAPPSAGPTSFSGRKPEKAIAPPKLNPTQAAQARAPPAQALPAGNELRGGTEASTAIARPASEAPPPARDELLGGLDELHVEPTPTCAPVVKVSSTPEIIDMAPSGTQESQAKVKTHTRLGSRDLEDLYSASSVQEQQLTIFGSPTRGESTSVVPPTAQQGHSMHANNGGPLLNQFGYPVMQQQPVGGGYGAEPHGAIPPMKPISPGQTSPNKSPSPRQQSSLRQRSRDLDPFADLR